MSGSSYSDGPNPATAQAPDGGAPGGGSASGNGAGGVDAAAVQQAKREIQSIVQQIGDLSRADVGPDQYYEEFLGKVVSALAAIGGAIWTVSETGQLQLGYQINLRQTGLAENPIAQEQHGRLLHRVLTAPTGPGFQEGAIVPPQSGFGADDQLVSSDADEHAPANATDYLLVLAPVHNDQGPQGVVEVFQRPGGRPQVQAGYLRFLLQTCELAGDYLRMRRLAHLSDKQTLWEQLESFTRLAHERLNAREASYTIANEGRRLIGADRVTVAIGRGGRQKIYAISGQDTFDTRSNVSTLLTKVARAAAKTREDVWYTGDTSKLAPQVEKAIDAYVDESQTKAMAILPLMDRRGVDPEATEEEVRKGGRREGDVIGALVVEQMVDNRIADGFTQRVDVVRTHSETALANALEHEGLFLMPLWKALGKATWMFRRHTLPKTVLVTAAIVGAIAAAVLVEKDFTLEGDGKLRPAEFAYVFAQIDGKVKSIAVEEDDRVKADQAVAELQNIDFDKDLTDSRGKLKRVETEIETLRFEVLSGQRREDLTASDRAQKQARLAQLNEEKASLNSQLELLATKQDLLTIRSPIAGQVITARVQERLRGRPVRSGQVLMEVAEPEGDWVLEVEMPDKRLGHITEAMNESEDKRLKVDFLLATNTEVTLTGWLTEANVAPSAEVKGDDGNTVRLVVEFDQAEFGEVAADPKVGAEVRAKVHCGRRSLAYAYLHDVVDFIRAKILFRL